ncbi:MAG: hypothetical protein WEC59_04365 [Salibacteraceae bacterium]
MKSIIIATAILISTSINVPASKNIGNNEFKSQARSIELKREFKTTEPMSTMIYVVSDGEVKVVKEFLFRLDKHGKVNQETNDALISEVIINLLKRQYQIESVMDVPTGHGNGVKRCIGFTAAAH